MSLTAALLMCLAPVAIDGDTLRCAGDGPTIRVWGIGAPERGQPGFLEAKVALQKWIDGGVACQPKGTSWSRIVALCYNGTGRDIARQMLEVDQLVIESCLHSRGYYGTCTLSRPRTTAPDEFFCDDTPDLDPSRCGLATAD